MGPIIVEPIKSQEDLNRIVLELEEALTDMCKIPKSILKGRDGKRTEDEFAVVAVASDWHVFEQVRPQEVLAWTEIHRNGLKIKTLVLALMGDFVTNMLHEDQKESNAGPVQEEVSR